MSCALVSEPSLFAESIRNLTLCIEYCLAGIAPGMESLVDKKEASFVEATAETVKRAESV